MKQLLLVVVQSFLIQNYYYYNFKVEQVLFYILLIQGNF